MYNTKLNSDFFMETPIDTDKLERSHTVTTLQHYYTVNHKKGGSTFVIITLENLDGF